MCTNQKKIYNASRRMFMFVKCGHCPACQMENAKARFRRIKNAYVDGEMVLFVTLTYTPEFLPYIRPSELKEDMSFLNIYRDYDVRKVRKNSDYEQAYQKINRFSPISKIDCFEQKLFYNGEKLPLARGSHGKIGVIYFKDLQDFCKRLERNLFRHYGIVGSDYKMYKVSEYGETYFRPHFHLLVHIKSEDFSKFYEAIRASWPYDNQGLDRQIEVARNATSYVSKYLCRGSDFPKFFENRCFRPKCSFSKGYGFGNKAFTLPRLLDAIDKGFVGFTASLHTDAGQTDVNLLYPKYFVDRYFIKFKRYSVIDDDTFFQLLQCPRTIDAYGQYFGYTVRYVRGQVRDDFEIFKNQLRLRFFRFCSESGLVGRPEDLIPIFAYYYRKVWSVYNSNILKGNFENASRLGISQLELYDNLDEVLEFGFSHPLMDGVSDCVTDPNLFRSVMAKTAKLENDYITHQKRKKVNSAIYQESGMYI